MAEIEGLLSKWGLPANVIKNFTDQSLDITSFRTLVLPESSEDLRELIPSLRLRAVFRDKVLESQNSAFTSDPSLSSDDAKFSRPGSSNESDTAERPGSTLSIDIDSGVEDNSHSSKRSVDPSESSANPKRHKAASCSASSYNLEKALLNSGTGTYLWNLSSLSSIQSQWLADCIIEYELAGNLNKKLTKEIFLSMTEAIVSKYPEESTETYYIPYYKDSKNRKHAATGKLVDKYHNIPKPKQGHTARHDNVDDPDLLEQIKFLKKSVKPWDRVVECWANTVDERIDPDCSIADYYARYPCLSDSRGIQLLLKDFNHMYGDKVTNENILKDMWPTFMESAIRALNAESKRRKPGDELLNSITRLNLPETSDESKAVTVLLNLPELCLVFAVARKRGRNGAVWRPNAALIRNGFVSRINDIGDIANYLEKRCELLKSWGLTLQPFVLLVGRSDSEIYASYVLVNSVKYLFGSPLEAVDACFKVFFVLHADFSPEAVDLWLLLQKQIYNFTTDQDTKSSRLPALIKKFK